MPLIAGRPERTTCCHLLDFYNKGVEDRVWIEQIKANGWLPITADKGASGNGEKLPRVCRALGLVHIIYGPAIHRRSADLKATALAAVWLQVVRVWREQIGCGHMIRPRDYDDGFKLVDRTTQKVHQPRN